MSSRIVSSACAVVVGAALLSLAVLPAAAQDAAPRTPWGHPDLQGVWDFRTITPLERPAELADREFLTAEEAASLEQDVAERDARLLDRAPERTAAGRQRGPPGRRDAGVLQQLLARHRDEHHRHAADFTDRRSAERAHPRPHRERAAAGRGAASLPDRASRGFLAGPRRRRPVPPRPERGAAHRAGRLQPEPAGVPDPGPRDAAHRDGAHGARRAPRRAPPAARAHPAVVRRFARGAGRATRWSSRRRTSSATAAGRRPTPWARSAPARA